MGSCSTSTLANRDGAFDAGAKTRGGRAAHRLRVCAGSVHTRRVRRLFVLASVMALGGCVELGVVGDGTSISTGRASRGRIIDGVRMPDRGEGFFTRDAWR